MDKIHIALADDQQLFRQGIASLISAVPEFELVFEAENGALFMTQLDTRSQPLHVALIDMEMPVMDGMELNTQIQNRYPDTKTIVLSVHFNERLIARMIQAGASGFLPKNCDRDELLTAIKTVHKSGFYITDPVLKALQSGSSKVDVVKSISGIPIDLSPREKEVLQFICQELTNAEIAEKLFVSPRTIDGHRNNLLAKTGCRNTAGLVLFAVKYHIHNLSY
ncbi:DNA-binding response regulator [Taibaiella sp. KBW10]|uniref:response regulator transcription factor n=1 Tax=Taibaiella sp. KBW10 TaxID=2153357 RepID=UPI000F5B225A|nr:response regulator transcription factor [Taibaiella sp. KBW10]RQO30685.1 DNA-binding response regulator [Taibaiella sp. KBW10]